MRFTPSRYSRGNFRKIGPPFAPWPHQLSTLLTLSLQKTKLMYDIRFYIAGFLINNSQLGFYKINKSQYTESREETETFQQLISILFACWLQFSELKRSRTAGALVFMARKLSPPKTRQLARFQPKQQQLPITQNTTFCCTRKMSQHHP